MNVTIHQEDIEYVEYIIYSKKSTTGEAFLVGIVNFMIAIYLDFSARCWRA